MEEEYKKRFTKHDIDCGYYVDEELACEEIKSNIDGSIGIQGDAISKLAILENMIEDGELVEVVRCKDCKHRFEALYVMENPSTEDDKESEGDVCWCEDCGADFKKLVKKCSICGSKHIDEYPF